MIETRVQQPDGSSATEKLPLLLPEKVLAFLFSNCGLSVHPQLVSAYWCHWDSVSNEWAKSTLQFRRSVEKSGGQVMPLGFYGDEAVIGIVNAPFNKIYGLFLNLPLYRPKSTRLSRYLLFSIDSEKMVSVTETLYPVLDAIVCSLNKLAEEGLGNMRFLTTELRGDQLFYKALFRHHSWWKATSICFRCSATVRPGPLVYTCYDGIWAATKRSVADFVLEEPPFPLCHLPFIMP